MPTLEMDPILALAKDRRFKNRRRRVLDRIRRQQWETETQMTKSATRIAGRIVDVPYELKRKRATIIRRISIVESMREHA